jgi:hypothetical protein
VATVVALVAWLLTGFSAVLVAAGGVGGATGLTDYRVPGPGIVSFTPTWSASAAVALTSDGVRGDPTQGTTSFRFLRSGEADGRIREYDAEVQPVGVLMSGEVVLGAEPGWSGLMFSVFLMAAAGLAVLALILFQVWRLLQATAVGEPFTREAVRRMRVIGWLVIGWQIAQPVAWLFLSPKAFDIATESSGAAVLALGDQEPGGPSLAVLALGALVLVLAEVFRHGAEIEDDRRLTV